jgi:hypothetical protein
MTWKICTALACAVLAGCVSDPSGGGDDTGDDEALPPEEPMIACEGDGCGLPGDEPCCDGSSCTDFGNWGGTVCAAECDAHEDCGTGCCDRGVCAPEEFCGSGGIVPEALCEVRDICDWWEGGGCVDAVEGCLANLTEDQVRIWTEEMARCFEQTTCSGFDACYWEVPWC